MEIFFLTLKQMFMKNLINLPKRCIKGIFINMQ